MTDLTLDQQPEGWTCVAQAYDTIAAPFTALFAEDALRLANVQPGQRVLDVAAGTGALSFAAVERGAEVLATDFSPGMVEHLRDKVVAQGIRGTRRGTIWLGRRGTYCGRGKVATAVDTRTKVCGCSSWSVPLSARSLTQ